MTRDVIIIGAGAAGLAAAWSAKRQGLNVTVVAWRPGASSLSSGAVDDLPWERVAIASRDLGAELVAPELAADVADFSSALGLWALPSAPSLRPRLATVAGRIRPARGYDRALLDLAEIRDGRVVLPRTDRAGWDADAIAAALSADPFARSRGITFEAADIPVLRLDDERRIPDADLAARHDESARLDWLADRLRVWTSRAITIGGPVAAVLVGPWLGALAPRAEELSSKAGVRTGEALVGVGSPAGLRFDAARDRMLASIGVNVVRDRAVSIVRSSDRSGGAARDTGSSGRTTPRFAISLGRAGGEISLKRDESPLVAGAVVLAIGGLVGGGITYMPPESLAETDLPPRGRVPFELSLRAPFSLSMGARASLDIVSSLHGPPLDQSAWPTPGEPGALEAVGVACDGVRVADGIVAAGDVIAGRPRTLLEAVAAGIRAGREIV